MEDLRFTSVLLARPYLASIREVSLAAIGMLAYLPFLPLDVVIIFLLLFFVSGWLPLVSSFSLLGSFFCVPLNSSWFRSP
jgi:hypothetical protein